MSFWTSLGMVALAVGVGFVTGGWGYALLLGGMALLSVMIMPKPKGINMKPASLSDFSMTTAQEGSPVPIVYGQVKIPANIIWYGNLEVVEIKQDAGGGSGGGGSSTTVGYKYYIDMWQAICQGKIKLLKIYKNEKPMFLTKQSDPFNSYDLPENYLVGFQYSSSPDEDYSYYIFNDGTTSDHPTTSDTNISDWIETRLPDVAHIFFKRFYVGNNTFVPTLQFLVRRELDTPFSYIDIIDTTVNKYYGNNPASVVYDLLINQIGMNESFVDLTSFEEASIYFNEKKYGINKVISSVANLWDEIENILSTFDAFLYLNDKGKLAIKIIKDTDIEVGTIEDDFIDFSLSKETIENIPNMFKANIVNNGVVETVYTENPAIKRYIKVNNLKVFDLTLLNDKDVALSRLYGLVKKYSYPFAVLTIKVPIKYSIYNLGDVIRIINSENNINGLFRIISISEENVDKNEIQMTLLQETSELYDKNEGNLIASQDNNWNRIDFYVEPINNVRVIEVDERQNTFVVLVPKQKGNEVGYHIYYSFDNIEYNYLKTCYTFTNLYTLASDYSSNTYDIDDSSTGILLNKVYENLTFNTIDRNSLFASERYVVIDNEFMKFQTITPESSTQIRLTNIIRGTKFSSKANHTAGTYVYIGYLNDNFFILNNVPNTFYIKIIPFNDQDTLDLADAIAITVNYQNLYNKPKGISRVVAVADSSGNVKIDAFIRVNHSSVGAGKTSPDVVVDQYPFPDEGDLLVSFDNWNTYSVYDSFNITLTGLTLPTAIYLKQRLNGYTSQSVSFSINYNETKIINVAQE